MNFKLGFLIYEGEQSTKAPAVRTPDIHIEAECIRVENDTSDRNVVNPNQIKTISSTARTLLADNTTQFAWQQHLRTSGSTRCRLLWTGTGTAPNFRTNRNIGGAADTVVTFSRLNDYVARITQTAGTAFNLAGVQIGDFIKIDVTNDYLTSPFATSNQKEFLVQAVGANYLDFVDNGNSSEEVVTLGADFAKVIKVLSQGDVLLGDTLSIESATGINPSNVGAFEVVNVSDNFVEFVNPLCVEQTLTNIATSIVVYEYLIGMICIRASGPFSVRFGAQTEWTQVGLLGGFAMFFASVNTHKVQIKNTDSQVLKFSVQTTQIVR
jgi:hypothetical protein